MAAAWQAGQFPMGPWAAGMGQYPMDPAQELQFLKDQAQMLAQQLEQISSRIDEIEETEKKEKKAGK
jgi:prefoldin subunit 5